jgi:hypothetical protein
MNQISQFFASHKISTHSIAAAILFLVGAYATVPQFHDLIAGIATAHPKLSETVTALIGLFMLYWKSQKGTQ